MKKMNKYHKLYEDIELVCLCIDAYEDAEEYLKPLRELIKHHVAVMKISVTDQTQNAGKSGSCTWQSRKIGTEKVCTYFLLKNTAK